VKRGLHELRVDGADLSGLFLEAMQLEGFEALRVGELEIARGERAPAFLIREGRAHFGWIFWEKFTAERWRKLFGSVVRNAKGDWAIQLGTGSREVVHVNLAGRVPTDPDRPSSLG
jgi:hypothetical protein